MARKNRKIQSHSNPKTKISKIGETDLGISDESIDKLLQQDAENDGYESDGTLSLMPSSAAFNESKGKRKKHQKTYQEDEDAIIRGMKATVEAGSLTAKHIEKKIAKKAASTAGSFQSMGLSRPVFKAVMKKGYRIPTPIQRRAIPPVLLGKDVVGMARTGSGKTAAFVIPMIERLKAHSQTVGVRSIVVTPTRELALQTLYYVRKIACHTDLRATVIVGGDSLEEQFNQLARNPDIIIATPGRLAYLIVQTGMSLKTIEYLVFDEADRLFEMGFAEQLHELLRKLPSSRQTLLFSATMPKMLVEFTRAGLKDPAVIRLDLEQKISEQLKMHFFYCRPDEKTAALLFLLEKVIPEKTSTIIFASTRHHVQFLYEFLEEYGIPSTLVFGSMETSTRNHNVTRFRRGEVPLMIVTDVAARGIDIPRIDNVINYDFPEKSKLFVHRVGRATRADRPGSAYSLLSNDEMPYMIDLFWFLGINFFGDTDEGQESGDEDQEEEVSQDRDKYDDEIDALNAKKQKNSKKEHSEMQQYGSLPLSLLMPYIEDIRTKIDRDYNLSTLFNSSENAFQAYSRSRSKPSKSAIKLAKKNSVSMHPMIEQFISKEQAEADAFALQCAAYRPKQTIMEKFRKSKHDEGNVATQKVRQQKHKMNLLNLSREQRLKQAHAAASKEANSFKPQTLAEKLLSGARKRGPEEMTADNDTDFIPPKKKKKKGYRSENYYLSSTQSNKSMFSEDQLAVNSGQMHFEDTMEMTPEELEQLGRTKTKVNRWDPKKRRYVMMSVDRHSSAKSLKQLRKDSNGTLSTKAKKDDRYRRWQQKTRMRIQNEGEEEDERMTQQIEDSVYMGPGRKGLKKQHHILKAKVKNTDQFLRTPDDIRRERNKKKKLQEKLARTRLIKKAGASAVLGSMAIEGQHRRAMQNMALPKVKAKLRVNMRTPGGNRKRR